MSKNSLGRELPEQVGSYRVRPYEGAYQPLPEVKPVVTRRTAGHRVPGGNKLVPTLKDAITIEGEPASSTNDDSTRITEWLQTNWDKTIGN